MQSQDSIESVVGSPHSCPKTQTFLRPAAAADFLIVIKRSWPKHPGSEKELFARTRLKNADFVAKICLFD
jgi:hypothetical protein